MLCSTLVFFPCFFLSAAVVRGSFKSGYHLLAPFCSIAMAYVGSMWYEPPPGCSEVFLLSGNNRRDSHFSGWALLKHTARSHLSDVTSTTVVLLGDKLFTIY